MVISYIPVLLCVFLCSSSSPDSSSDSSGCVLEAVVVICAVAIGVEVTVTDTEYIKSNCQLEHFDPEYDYIM